MKKRNSHQIGLALTVLASIMSGWSAAAIADTTLYVGMNGGTMQKVYEQFIFPPFEQANHVKVVVVPGTSADVLAKAQAGRANPQMHLMFLDDGLMYRAINMGLCEPTKLPETTAKQLYPQAHIDNDMATAVSMGLTGIGYNTKMFADNHWPKPTSWADLADPKYKGKLVFQSLPTSTFGLHAFLMYNRLKGGNETNTDPGFKSWNATVGKDVKVYIDSSSKLSEMIQTNEAGIFPLTPTLAAALKAQGIAVDYANPKEGGVSLLYAQCAIAHNNQPELTQKLANWVLSPEAQNIALEKAAYIPANMAVTGTGDEKAQLAVMKDYVKKAVTLDWDVINKNRPQWNKRWNREIEQ